jgi:hypothetical protein
LKPLQKVEVYRNKEGCAKISKSNLESVKKKHIKESKTHRFCGK